jgi:hypothetical protein
VLRRLLFLESVGIKTWPFAAKRVCSQLLYDGTVFYRVDDPGFVSMVAEFQRRVSGSGGFY